ncbi:MAG: aminotransferase class IV [Bdellovibrionales bacterium]|nr:aminotransferase class IV [Bdellovibrionales bacterium]
MNPFVENTIIVINGQQVDAKTASIPVFDRGFLYGDSLYEVARTYGGKALFMSEHLDRLFESAKLARMQLSQSKEEYRRQMEASIQAFRALPGQSQSEAYCRIIVTRGAGKIGFGLNCVMTPTQYVILTQKLEPPSAEQFQKGFKYRVVERFRNHPNATDPAMKSGNYLNSLLAFLEAGDGFDDALLCNADGHLTEGTTFNIFYVKNGIVVTSPLDIGILDGLTRRATLELAKKLKIPVREVRFPKERLYEADEVFMTSTIKEVFPVTKVDQHTIAKGKPGPITEKLNQAFRKEVQTWLA